MKKILIALVLLLGLTIIGCDSSSSTTTTTTTEEPNELQLAFEDFSNSTNVTMVMSMTDVPVFGTMVTTMKLDGDMSYVEVFGIEQYFKEVDGALYEYSLEGGAWVLGTEPLEDSGSYEFVDTDMFDFNDFEEVDGVWVLSVDGVYPDEDQTDYLVNVEITLDASGNIILMEYDVTSDDVTMGVSVVFSDYGTTEVALPTVD